MDKEQKILIAEDNQINRRILVKMFSDEYQVIEAVDGQEAIELLQKYQDQIVALLLDIIMPVKDGYDVLNYMKNEKMTQQIPVVVMTGDSAKSSEEKALDLGAWDFVSKPYEPRILMTRVKNAIARSKMSYLSQIKHVAEHDLLTNIYNRGHFYEMAEKIIKEHPEDTKAFIRIDIKRFHLINSFFGEKGGDELLKYVAAQIADIAEKYDWNVFGRIESDVFGVCVPYDEDLCRGDVKLLTDRIKEFNTEYLIEPSFGVYVITDDNLSAEDMFLNASLASMECKAKYMVSTGFYTPQMRERLQFQEEISKEMHHGLENGEFVVYYQPKYLTRSKTPCGAEALVRWINPQKGLIMPNDFIPVFEQNGFIGELDMYVWNAVCKQMRTWLDKGLEVGSISVNLARADVRNPNLVEHLTNLIEIYQLKPDMLNLEFTEGAYMDNPDAIKEVVDKLHEAGFTITMDDFGSGYSSLNLLKDIEVDFLKVDMKCLSIDPTNTKSRKILSSVIAMAQWLDIPVITEGVETEEEYTFLKSIGCEYIQGYYFSKPLPVEEIECIVSE